MKKKNGFSMIEFLVVISIIGILTAGVFLNYREGQNNMNLQRTGYKIANDFRRAETLAGLKRTECCPAGICPAGYKYSYGLSFDQTAGSEKKYIVFADCDGSKTRSAGDFDVEVVDLETNIVLDLLNGGVNNLDIVFIPPDPTASIAINSVIPVPPLLTTGSVRIKVNGGVGTKTIIVNSVGMIDLN